MEVFDKIFESLPIFGFRYKILIPRYNISGTD